MAPIEAEDSDGAAIETASTSAEDVAAFRSASSLLPRPFLAREYPAADAAGRKFCLKDSPHMTSAYGRGRGSAYSRPKWR